MIERMFEDTLWIYTAIGGSVAVVLGVFGGCGDGALDGAADHSMDKYINYTINEG